MIKNIIFDLGNVVLKLKWNIVLERYAREEYRELLEEVIFNSKEWKAIDRGTLEKEDALNIMLSKLPETLHDSCKNIMENWKDSLVINDEMVSFIKKVRNNGYKTYVLSNASLEIPPFLKDNDLEQYFDGKIISAEEKVLKPEHKIYEIFLEKFSLNPAECIFIDDKEENIEAAIECGLKGYVFDYNKFDTFLKDISIYLKNISE